MVEGSGRQGSLNWPAAISYDEATGELYVADEWDNVLVKID